MNMRSAALEVTHRLILPMMPRSRRSALHFWSYRVIENRYRHLRELHRLLPPANRRNTAIDAGANVGHYSWELARSFRQVFAFEVNQIVSRDLANASSKKIILSHMGLSNVSAKRKFYLPVTDRGMEMHGWGSLNPKHCPNDPKLREFVVELQPLDALRLDGVSFMKIDVEGHECEVLEGARQTIERSRPNILVEIQPENDERIQRFFRDLKFRELGSSDGVDMNCWPENRAFVPI